MVERDLEKAALRGEPTADGVRLTWEPPAPALRYNVYRGIGDASLPDDPLNPDFEEEEEEDDDVEP